MLLSTYKEPKIWIKLVLMPESLVFSHAKILFLVYLPCLLIFGALISQFLYLLAILNCDWIENMYTVWREIFEWFYFRKYQKCLTDIFKNIFLKLLGSYYMYVVI